MKTYWLGFNNSDSKLLHHTILYGYIISKFDKYRVKHSLHISTDITCFSHSKKSNKMLEDTFVGKSIRFGINRFQEFSAGMNETYTYLVIHSVIY